jgi:hypothetical protein
MRPALSSWASGRRQFRVTIGVEGQRIVVALKRFSVTRRITNKTDLALQYCRAKLTLYGLCASAAE